MTTALLAVLAVAACGHSAVPAVDATGSKAFVYDIVHRTFAGKTFAGTKQTDLLSLGQGLCSQLDKGHSVAQLNAGMQATKTLRASAEEDGQLVATAVLTLCPRYTPSITPVSSPAAKSPAG